MSEWTQEKLDKLVKDRLCIENGVDIEVGVDDWQGCEADEIIQYYCDKYDLEDFQSYKKRMAGFPLGEGGFFNVKR